jgi:hypothetical protein
LGKSEIAECRSNYKGCEAQTNHVSLGSSQDRSVAACTMGKGEAGGLTFREIIRTK